MKTTTVSKRLVALLCCIAVCVALIATALGVNLAGRAQAEDAQNDGIELLEEEPADDIQIIEEETETVPEDNTGTEAYQGEEPAVIEDAVAPAEEPVSGEPIETPVHEGSIESDSPVEPEDSTEPEGLPEERIEPGVAGPAGSEEPAEPDLTGTEATSETVDAAEAKSEDIDADVEKADAEDANAEEEATSDEDDYGIMLLEMIEGPCGDDVRWVLDEDSGVLFIYGSGAMYDWSKYSDVPWYSSRESITSVIIDEGVTSIGDDAFYGCTNLTYISIPDGVISIGDNAFAFCESLENVELPSTLTSIGDYAFVNCIALTGISITDGVTSTGEGTFEYCMSLESVELPSTLTTIDDSAFVECIALTNISIPEGVISIDEWAFAYCDSLVSVELPSTLTSIGEYAFWYCPLDGDSMCDTTMVNAGAAVYSIDSDETTQTTDTTEYTGHTLTIPESVTSVGSNAFSYTSVDIFVIGSNLTSITGSAFASSSLDAIIFDNFQDQVDIDNPKNISSNGSLVYLRGESPIEVTVAKQWDDDNNHDGLRPAGIDVQLIADGVVIDTQTLSEDNSWSYTWDSLDVYADGQEIVYEVIESETPAGYTQSDTGMVKDDDGNYSIIITNNHEVRTIIIHVNKEWDDANNHDGLRPGSIDVQLLADGVVVDTQTLSENNDDWNYTWEGFDVYADGHEIDYEVIEPDIPAGYTQSDTFMIKDDNGNYFIYITNTHETQKTDIAVTKVWDDGNNQDGLRPASIDVQLLADGVECGDPVTLDDSNNWSYTWYGLDVYADGQEIVYEVIELTAPGVYSQSDTGMVKDDDGNYSITITNTHQPYTTDHAVTKVWEDADDQDGIRPSSVSVQLLADGVAYGDPVTLDDSNDWTYRWVLPIYAAGSEISYSVEEAAIEGYTPEILDERLGFTIINTHTPETIDIPVAKVWDDANNADGIRPESITVRLLADGVEIDSITYFSGTSDPTLWPLSDNNDAWSFSFNGYDKYRDGGIEIVYTITEDEVDGYTTEISGDAESGFTITNSYTPEQIDISGTKTWDDADDQDGIRPESITVRLLADGTEVDSVEVTPDSEGTWSYTFEGLNKYRDGRQEIVYTITEDAIDDYETSYGDLTDNGDGTYSITITNSHETKTTDISVSKLWDDEEDQDGIRPGSVTVDLLADGSVIDIVILDESNYWHYRWEGLPANAAGSAISYSVEETDVPEGYFADYDGEGPRYLMIANTHIPETIDISGTMVWDDADNQDGIRPDSITVRLLADGVAAVDDEGNAITTTATAADNYAWNFSELPKYRDGGVEIVYSVTEDDVWGYVNNPLWLLSSDSTSSFELMADDASTDKSVTITNTHIPEAATPAPEMSDDVGAGTEVNPGESLTYTIRYTNGGEDGATITITDVLDEGLDFVSATDNGTYDEATRTITWIITDVPANYEGSVSFTVVVNESALTAGEVSNSATVQINDEPAVATNTVTNPVKAASTVTFEVVKVWNDNNDLYGARPDRIVVVLLENGQATSLTQLLSAENSWTGTFSDLPEYDANGQKIVYGIAEVTVPNYTSVITGDQDSGFTVTNTYDFDEITNPEPGTPNTGNPQPGNPDDGVPQTGQDSLPIAPLAVSGAAIVAAGVALLAVRRRRAA